MTRLLLCGAAAGAILIGGGAFAQSTPAPAPTPAPQAHVEMHRMPMKATTRDEVVAHVRDMFAKFDTNKDGFVTREEAGAAHQRMAGEMHEKFAKRMAERGDLPKPDRAAAFDRLDANKDGMISRQEFMSAQPQIQERRMIVMREGGEAGMPGKPGMHRMGMGFGHGRMFEMADANKDGRVSLQEATAAAVQHFDSADLNHDGTLTPEEKMQAHQRLRADRKPA